MRMGLKPLSNLYKKIVGFKNYLYDKDYFQSLELPVPVLSLGNLTMGGTGKTPLTDFCLKYYQRRKIKTAVVSRNYKAEITEAAEVDLKQANAAAYFGDEPVLLAERNPNVHFFVGPLKYETAHFAVEKINPALVVVDDGFQHRKLHRDVDIVILDATEKLENYVCLPVGRAREPWEALARATAFVVTKVNLAPAHQVDELIKKLRPFGKLIVPMSYELMRIRAFQGPDERQLKDMSGRKVMLISGIAQPLSFEKNLESFTLQLVGHLKYRDHHPYSKEDVGAIVKQWRDLGSPELITTEKDFVKLRALWPKEVPLWYSPLEVRIQAQEDGFYEILDQVLH